MDKQAIAGALGLESAYGFHIEEEPGPPLLLARDRRRALPWYPCLMVNQTYTGCLGDTCPVEECWTGALSVSYQAALRRHYSLTEGEYAAGARCLCCCHVEEIAIPVIVGCRLIHLIALRCHEQCWRHPISAAAFVRRHIPACEDTDLRHCPAFAQAWRPIPAVEQQREQVNERMRALRAGKIAKKLAGRRRHHG